MSQLILNERDYNSVIEVPRAGVFDAAMTTGERARLREIVEADERIESLLIPAPCIAARNRALARQIVRDYAPARHLEVLVVLTGGVVFASDICRDIFLEGNIHARFNLIKTSVYDKSIKDSGEEYRTVRLLMEPQDVEGKDVLIMEDITDQGFTLTWMLNYLRNERHVNSVKICSLLDKRLANPTEKVKLLRDNLTVDYRGFIIEDQWIAGYGIDTADDFRNLPFIVVINEGFFKG